MTYQELINLKFKKGISTYELVRRFPKEIKRVSEVALLDIAYAPQNPASLRHRRQVAALLGVPEHDVPTLHVQWAHLEQS